jgi:hypothetical protein
MLLLHSGLRYVILVVAVAVLGYGLSGVVTRRPFDERMRKLGSLLAVSLHAEILIGLGLLFTGSFSPAVTGHVFMMLFAAGTAQVVPSVMRRRPPEQRSYLPYLISTAVALALVAGGIMALGRPVLG